MAGEHRAPRITFTGLVQIMSGSATAQMNVMRAHRFPKDGPMLSYAATRSQLASWLVDGKPLDPGQLRDYEREIAVLLAEQDILPGPTDTYRRPPTQQSLVINNVEVSMKPDLTVEANDKRGALKCHFSSSVKLTEDVGRHMAALLYYYGREVLGDESYHPSLCRIYDVREGTVHTATGTYRRLMKNVQDQCAIIAAVWPALTE